jgi:hypothetical protein
VKLGTENRNQLIVAAVLGVVLLAVLVYQFMPSSSTIASTAPATSTMDPVALPAAAPRPAAHHGSGTIGKKERAPQSLDPTLQLQLLATSQAIKYEGSGRNIFIAQAEDVTIPKPLAPGRTDHADKKDDVYHPPAVAAAPPIPLKFFGFANRPGEAKKVFLIKGDDTFIAGEGEIVDRRYKVVKISPTSVDIQDVVVSGPPQSIPLTLGNPS